MNRVNPYEQYKSRKTECVYTQVLYEIQSYCAHTLSITTIKRCVLLKIIMVILLLAPIRKGFSKEPTMDKIMAAMSTTIGSNDALDLVIVRSEYPKVNPNQLFNSISDAPERSFTSELKINSNGINESVIDNRLVGSVVARKFMGTSAKYASKENTVHYVKNTRNSMIFDPNYKRGSISTLSKRENHDYMVAVFLPGVQQMTERFLGRSESEIYNRLRNAIDIALSKGTQPGLLVVTGAYRDSQPYQTFRMEVDSYNNILHSLVEYNTNNQELLSYNVLSHKSIMISGKELTLPSDIIFTMHIYDDLHENSIKFYRYLVLKIENLKDTTGLFDIKPSAGEKIYDSQLDLDFSKFKQVNEDLSKLAILTTKLPKRDVILATAQSELSKAAHDKSEARPPMANNALGKQTPNGMGAERLPVHLQPLRRSLLLVSPVLQVLMIVVLVVTVTTIGYILRRWRKRSFAK